jgi:hypothetical protein
MTPVSVGGTDVEENWSTNSPSAAYRTAVLREKETKAKKGIAETLVREEEFRSCGIGRG